MRLYDLTGEDQFGKDAEEGFAAASMQSGIYLEGQNRKVTKHTVVIVPVEFRTEQLSNVCLECHRYTRFLGRCLLGRTEENHKFQQNYLSTDRDLTAVRT